ncbi:hypothetical protein HK097_011402 [Rhizophlyctis rosea]|uniref:Uncharacterized protein n=1 Tax=Rhizophlyctis rosea TaxID=64517 RepID=A0AAD5S852_9FUNG|nr:hypothetical protein HK097_011402 [Rhizophlyctis rosea]
MQPPPIITHHPSKPRKLSFTHSQHSQPSTTTPSSSLFSPNAATSSGGLPHSFSQSSLANVSKSLATLDAAKVLSSMGLPDVLGNVDNGWQVVCVKTLPLFNGGRLKGRVEDLNGAVRIWLREREMAPHIAIEELYELLSAGMLTLTNKLSSAAEDTFASRAVEVWSFFFGEVVPYLEGVFLPVKLYWEDMAGDLEQPDIRTMALSAFRDLVILPLRSKLEESLPKLFLDIENGRKASESAARLLQMLLIIDGVSENDEAHSQVNELLATLKEQIWAVGKAKQSAVEPSMPPSRPISVIQT